MLPAPLQLNRCFIGALHLVPAEEKPTTTAVTVTVTPTIARHETSDREWMVIMKVSFKGAESKAAPYSGEIDVQGFFTVEPAYPSEKINHMIAVTCPSMLYAVARETVASLSARGRHGVFLLPAVSFNDHELRFDAGKIASTRSQPTNSPSGQ